MWKVLKSMLVRKLKAAHRGWKTLFCRHEYEWPRTVDKRDERGRFDGYRITSKCRKCGYEL